MADTHMSTLRHAEKSRPSSCPFADYVARESIKTYTEVVPDNIRSHIRQTVIASFVVRRDGLEPSAEVVALGGGTKFMRAADIRRDTEATKLHDSHAEVLARRALQCFLLDEIEREIAGFKTKTSSSMFQLDEAGVLTLRPGVTLHMYTSSQPCGNASLKRWAKGKTPVYQGLGPMDVPEQSHPRLHMPPQALSEGMAAVLLKREPSMSPADLGAWEPACDKSGTVPPGAAPLSSGCGRVLTCSDKMARWNAVGVQGTLLSAITGPLYLRSITVGRKFSEPHCARALCCRLQDFVSDRIADLPEAYSIHHPALLGTGVKLDEGVYDTAAAQQSGAEFSDVAFIWRAGMGEAHILDGSSGAPHRAHWPASDAEQTNQRLAEPGEERVGMTTSGVAGHTPGLDGDLVSPFSSFAIGQRFARVYSDWCQRQHAGNGGSQECSTAGHNGAARKADIPGARHYMDAKRCLYTQCPIFAPYGDLLDTNRSQAEKT